MWNVWWSLQSPSLYLYLFYPEHPTTPCLAGWWSLQSPSLYLNTPTPLAWLVDEAYSHPLCTCTSFILNTPTPLAWLVGEAYSHPLCTWTPQHPWPGWLGCTSFWTTNFQPSISASVPLVNTIEQGVAKTALPTCPPQWRKLIGPRRPRELIALICLSESRWRIGGRGGRSRYVNETI